MLCLAVVLWMDLGCRVAEPVLAQEALGPRTSVFLSDAETDVWAPGVVAELASRSARWACA
jgi:hypothetical protein